jgi:hypothetical protein
MHLRHKGVALPTPRAQENPTVSSVPLSAAANRYKRLDRSVQRREAVHFQRFDHAVEYEAGTNC